MADVTSAFLQGHAYAQAESEHEQALQDSKLRQQILKHQIDEQKINDQIRTRELARQNFELTQGQPAEDIPSDNVTTTQANLPSRNLAGVITGLIGARTGMDTGGSQPVSSTAPGMIPAPAAQAETPGTNSQTTRVARSINIPGVDAINGAAAVPGVNLRPRSLQEMLAAQAYAEAMKPFDLGEGQTRYAGGVKVAQGSPKPITTAAGAVTTLDPDNPNSRTIKGPPRTAPTPSPESLDLQRQRIGATNARTAATAARGKTTDARAQENADRLQYATEIAPMRQQDTQAFRVWQAKAALAASPDEIDEPPTPKTPTFEEWQAKRAKTSTAAPKEGDTKEIPGYAGTEMTFKGGKWIRTK